MKRLWSLTVFTAVLWTGPPALAHPAPFSFVDVRVQPTAVDVTIVVHTFDVAYEIGLQPPDRVLDPAVLGTRSDRLVALLRDRLLIIADGRRLRIDTWSVAEPLPERQSLRFQGHLDLEAQPGVINISGVLFPYDPAHQTFVNVYEGGSLRSQAILDEGRTQHEYFVGSVQGTFAVFQKFIPAGIQHILIGPDHILFLVGLLLLGGSLRQLALVVTSFTLAHSITLSLAVLGILSPPGSVVEPLIALSIVYVGVDNLLARGGRDVRVWIALTFGFIHGFGFANVLREMNLPREALGWSLFSFNAGVELGQLVVVVVVASALTALRAWSDAVGQRVAYAGSVVVIAAGAFWFVQRVFLTGGMA